MSNELVELETNALFARDRSDFNEAIRLLEKLVGINPLWEHGEAFYNLAGCYEDVGNLDKAEENYLRALNIAPENWYFVGGYAAFLDQYGDPRMAFEWYLKLLKIELQSKPVEWGPENEEQIDRIKNNLYTLGGRLGWNEDDVEKMTGKL